MPLAVHDRELPSHQRLQPLQGEFLMGGEAWTQNWFKFLIKLDQISKLTLFHIDCWSVEKTIEEK